MAVAAATHGPQELVRWLLLEPGFAMDKWSCVERCLQRDLELVQGCFVWGRCFWAFIFHRRWGVGELEEMCRGARRLTAPPPTPTANQRPQPHDFTSFAVFHFQVQTKMLPLSGVLG